MLYFQRVKTAKLAAVTHVDGSARAQTIKEEQNPMLYKLLSEFKRQTGTGILCNTSLNFPGRGFINRLSDLVEYARNRSLDGFVVGDKMYLNNKLAEDSSFNKFIFSDTSSVKIKKNDFADKEKLALIDSILDILGIPGGFKRELTNEQPPSNDLILSYMNGDNKAPKVIIEIMDTKTGSFIYRTIVPVIKNSASGDIQDFCENDEHIERLLKENCRLFLTGVDQISLVAEAKVKSEELKDSLIDSVSMIKEIASTVRERLHQANLSEFILESSFDIVDQNYNYINSFFC